MLTNVKARGIRCIEILCIENNTMYCIESFVYGSRAPAARGQWGFGGRALDTAAILYRFFSKKYAFFRNSFGINFAILNG